jgi:hypothetical protein
VLVLHDLDDDARGAVRGGGCEQQPDRAVGQQHPFLTGAGTPVLGGVAGHDVPVLRVEGLVRGAVGDDEVLAEGEDRAAGTDARGAERGHHRAGPGAAPLAQHLFDVLGGLPGEEPHEVVGLGGQAGDVEDPGERAAGAVHRGARAREGAQPVGEVLGADHHGVGRALERRADPVGAGELLGVAEAGGQRDGVEPASQLALPDAPVEDVAVGVGEHHGDRHARQPLGEVVEDRAGAVHQAALEVQVRVERQREVVGVDPGQPGPFPRLHDLRPDHTPFVDGAVAEEPFAGAVESGIGPCVHGPPRLPRPARPRRMRNRRW